MAETETVTTPTVQQSGGPLPVSPPAEAFGATALGQAGKAVGQAFGQASDELSQRALQIQDMNNKANADQAWQQYVTTSSQFASDYKQHNLEKAAGDNLGQAYTGLENIRMQIGRSLTSPAARAMYDQDTRRFSGMLTEGLATHAATEAKKWRLDVQQGNLDTVKTALWKNPDLLTDNSPGSFNAKYYAASAAMDHENGVDPAHGAWVAKVGWSKIASDIIEDTATKGDYTKAEALYKQLAPQMDPETAKNTEARITPGIRANEAASEADAVVNNTLAEGKAGAKAAAASYEKGGPESLVTLKTSSGQSYQVNSAYAPNFQGFMKDLEASGYKVASVGGYSDRDVAGTDKPSYHAQGAAIDINPAANVQGTSGNLPANVQQLARKWGLGWGGSWASKKDPMHFSIAQEEGGSIPLDRHPGAYITTHGDFTSVGMEGMRVKLLADTAARAEQLHPGDAVFADTMLRRAEWQLNNQISAARGTEAVTGATLMKTAEDYSVRDIATLIARTPNGLALWNSLPEPDRMRLRDKISENGRTNTVDRETRFGQIQNMYTNAKLGQPDEFMGINFMHEDLTLGQAQWGMEAQGRIREKKEVASDVDKAWGQQLHSVWMKNARIQFGFNTNNPNAPAENAILEGVLRGEISRFREQNGRLPKSDDEWNRLIYPFVLANTYSDIKGKSGVSGQPFAHAPRMGWEGSEAYKMAVAGLNMTGYGAPPPGIIAGEMAQNDSLARALLAQRGEAITQDNINKVILNGYQNQASAAGRQFGYQPPDPNQRKVAGGFYGSPGT